MNVQLWKAISDLPVVTSAAASAPVAPTESCFKVTTVRRDHPHADRYQPEVVVINADLIEQGLDSADEWIRSCTGVIERRLYG
jgi:hypothetical protein